MKAFVMFLAVAIGAVAAIAASQDAAATAGKTTATAPTTQEAKSEMTTVYGVVTSYEPGRSITVAQPDRRIVTYAIDRHSALPAKLRSGRHVVVRTITRPGLERPLVRKVTVANRKAS